MKIKILSVAAATASLLLASAPLVSSAASPLSVGAPTVTANVVADCVITTPGSGGFAFGSYDDVNPSGGAPTASPTYKFSFGCNNGTSWDVQGVSANAGGAPADFPLSSNMQNGSYKIPYTISASQTSGTSASSTAIVNETLSGSATPTGAHTGSYSDTVTVTLSFS